MQKTCNILAILLLCFIAMRPTTVTPSTPEPPEVTTPVVAPADLVVFVYESSEAPLTSDAIGAANSLTASGIEVRMIDQDVVTGDGRQPAEVKAALEAAKNATLPALVVMGGGAVLTAVPLPATREAIVEAVNP